MKRKYVNTASNAGMPEALGRGCHEPHRCSTTGFVRERCGHPQLSHSMLPPFATDSASEIERVRPWLDLPGRLFDRAEKARIEGFITPATVTDVEVAIVVAILCSTGMRLGAIATLRCGGSDANVLVPKAFGRHAWIRMSTSASALSSPLQTRLDEKATAVLQAYLTHYRADAARQRKSGKTSLLFPPAGNSKGDSASRSRMTLSRAFKRRMQEVGCSITPNQLRHFSARLALEATYLARAKTLLNASPSLDTYAQYMKQQPRRLRR